MRTDAITLSSNWTRVELANLVAPSLRPRHPVPCTSTVQGQVCTYYSESHTRALYLAADVAANTTPGGAEEAWNVQREAAESALYRLSEDGLWVHDVSGQQETHFRFQNDGVDLLLVHFRRTGDVRYRQAARQALAAVLAFADPLDDGSLWFLHDTFERDWTVKHARSPSMRRSTCLGKSLANTLTLNTHVQTLYVLWRYGQFTGSDEFLEHYRRGRMALERVLNLHPPAIWGTLFDRAIVTIVRDPPRGTVAALQRKLAWKLLAGAFIPCKARQPWFVHPSGYIDRDIMVTVFHVGYHVLNLADLLILHSCDPLPTCLSLVRQGVRFCQQTEYLACLSREAHPPRPLYLDVLLLLMRLSESPDEWLCRSVLDEVAALATQNRPPTAAAYGFDPYFVSEWGQLWVDLASDAPLHVFNITPHDGPQCPRFLIVNLGEGTETGVVRCGPRVDTTGLALPRRFVASARFSVAARSCTVVEPA